MRKRNHFLVSVLLMSTIILGTGSLWGCSSPEEPSDKMPAELVDKTWYFYDEFSAEHLCLTLGSDNAFSYHCQCGEPVGDSDIYDQYTYDEEKEIIILSNDSEDETKEVKVLGYNEYHLLLEIDGEIKDFGLVEMDIPSNFYAFEGDKYFKDYESLCTVVNIEDGKLIYAPLDYDPEGLYAEGPFEEFELAQDYSISEVIVRSYNSIQAEQEYEEFYNVTETAHTEDVNEYMENRGSGMAFLWFNDNMQVEKIVFHGETSATADWIAVEIPAEEAGKVTQEQLDEEADKDNSMYDAAHLNEDGSIICLMTKEQHEAYKNRKN